MNVYATSSIFITLAVALAALNHRFIKMQATVAIMMGGLLVSLLLIVSNALGMGALKLQATHLLSGVNFHSLLIDGMLSFMLFAGALNLDMTLLKNEKWEIGTLATIGTIVSTLLIGTGVYAFLDWQGINIPMGICMLFGALISPTDPIAVLATLKKLGAPKRISVKIAGESLFNDGVGIVIFLTLFGFVFDGKPMEAMPIILLFIQQAVGGILYGVGLARCTCWMIGKLDDAAMAIMVTLAVTTGGYTLAQHLGVSGPLAMVVTGLYVGKRNQSESFSLKTRQSLAMFWELIDEILNAVLFMLIGLEILLIDISQRELLFAVCAIPLVLFVRLMTVAVPMSIFSVFKRYDPWAITTLIWGGLRGGLAVALALALPDGPYRHLILVMTYSVVVFALLVQATTIQPLVNMINRRAEEKG